MSTALLIITDGRDDYLRQCVDSTREGLSKTNVTERWMFDDTGDNAYRHELRLRYPEFRHIDAGPRRGCAGAIRYAWRWLRSESQAQYVFHLEGDFTINQPLNTAGMSLLLLEHPEIVQVALRRNPVNDLEIAAGGVIEQHPDWYIDRFEARQCGQPWLEHGAYFTCNPCLYRKSLVDAVDWPEHRPGRYSEDTFHHETLPAYFRRPPRYAYWGARTDAPLVTHIGSSRHQEGTGY